MFFKCHNNNSMSPTTTSERTTPKFTRGEKCIFGHIIVTFVVILILAILFFIHLCVVNHTLYGAFKITRRAGNKAVGQHFPLGLIYLSTEPTQAVCNSLLLKKKWSLAPGHCAALRTDPDVASLLRSWRIKYITRHGRYLESDIVRSIPHPHFDRDDFSNNIGLFQHERALDNYDFVFPKSFNLGDGEIGKRIDMVAWENDAVSYKGENGQIVNFTLRPVLQKKCRNFIAPVVELRSYEFCALLERTRNYYPEHGAVIAVDSKIIGFFSWGEKRGRGVPYIIVNILHFKNWIEDTISL